MEPNGSENFKTLLLLQIAAKSFETCPEFSSQWSSQSYVWDFWNFENWNFNKFVSFSSTWPHRECEFQNATHSMNRRQVSKLLMNFPPNGPPNIRFLFGGWGIFDILRFLFYLFIYGKPPNWSNPKP